MAQVSASAGISATIITPIAITKSVDMDFGNIGAGNTSGRVMLAPDGNRTQQGGVSLPSLTGTVKAAAFQVSGSPNTAFAVTLPDQPLQISNGTDYMTVGTFVSEPAGTGMLSPTGSQELRVGATLTVDALQPVGDYYASVPFPVTVNYN